MWGENFRIINGMGQSNLAAGLESIRKIAEQKAAEKNARDLAAVKTFNTENSDLYGDEYKAKAETFRNDPANWNAVKRYGNAIQGEKREPPEEQLKRLQNEYRIGMVNEGADPNAGWEAKVRRRQALGERVLASEIQQYIIEDPKIPEDQKAGFLRKWGIVETANNAANNVARLKAAEISADIRKTIAEMQDLRRQQALAQNQSQFEVVIKQKNDQFNARMNAATAKMNPFDRMQGSVILQEMTKLNSDLIAADNKIANGPKDGVMPARGGETQKQWAIERSNIMAKLANANAQWDAISSKYGGGTDYLDNVFGGLGGNAPEPPTRNYDSWSDD
jgi:hypothetical protein